MTRKHLHRWLALLSALALLSGLLLSGCKSDSPAGDAPAEMSSAPETGSQPAEKGQYLFNCLNPCPDKPPIEVTTLANRLDTLDGKTLCICANYNNNLTDFPDGLAYKLQELLPNTKILYVSDMLVAEGQATYPRELDAPITNIAF